MNGDRLRISIIEAPEMSHDYAIAGDGTIDIELIGRIQLTDLTPEEAAAKIEALLEKDYFKQATVAVEVSTFVEGNIILLGEVARPGPVQFKGDQLLTLVEAIAQSGGLTPSANGKEVRVIRWKPGGGMERQILTVDVQSMMASLDFTGDQFLRARDMIIVPRLGQGDGAGEFLALGEVSRPGFHPHGKGMDLIRAMSVIGGFNRDANLGNARILRPDTKGGYQVLSIDLGRLFNAADMTQNATIQAGDIIFVPSLSQSQGGRIYLLGAVAQPGAYPLPLDSNATLARTILAYGGLQRFSAGKRVKLLRFAPDGNKQTLEVNVENILKTGAFEKDVPLKNEDVIIVPDDNLLGI